MTTDPRDILAMRAAQASTPSISRGSSSYFTAPTEGLDPNLFGSELPDDKLLPGVRNWIVSTGYGFLNLHYKGAQTWATIWIAGSGITHQWSAARSPGDLDVLVGVSTQSFKRHNPDFRGLSDTEIAHHITQTLRALGEQTAQQHIGNGVYEVTWYVNPGAADIRDINPYAAYDVTHDRWTVPPPDLPLDFGTKYFPAEWWKHIGDEKKRANDIINDYLSHRHEYIYARNYGHRINAAQSLEYDVVLAKTMFEDIHDNRRLAFSPTGRGYSDWNNFRWQAHKRNGVIPALHALAELKKQADEQANDMMYGHHPLATSEEALSTAALLHSHLGSLVVR